MFHQRQTCCSSCKHPVVSTAASMYLHSRPPAGQMAFWSRALSHRLSLNEFTGNHSKVQQNHFEHQQFDRHLDQLAKPPCQLAQCQLHAYGKCTKLLTLKKIIFLNFTFKMAVDWVKCTFPSVIHGRLGKAKLFWIWSVCFTFPHSLRSHFEKSLRSAPIKTKSYNVDTLQIATFGQMGLVESFLPFFANMFQ